MKTKSADDLLALGRYTDAVTDQFVTQIGAGNLKAIWLFTGRRDAKGAIKLLRENRRERDPAWLFNMAFLYAYDGQLRRARQMYRKAEAIDLDLDVLQQVEEFLEWLHGEEPDKVQILYCLGIIAWKIRGDLVAAEKEFSEFLTRCPPLQFVKDREVVQGWLTEIRAALPRF